MQKYSDLPDIDKESQELFETSDNDSLAEVPVENENDTNDTDNDIIKHSLDTKSAKEKFPATTIAEPTKIDFSGTIRNRSQGQSGYVLSSGEEESRNEKIARITRELEELKTEPGSTSTENEHLDHLTQLLESHTIDTYTDYDDGKLKGLFNSISERIQAQGTTNISTNAISLVDTSEILELEARLAKIEQLIGYDSIVGVDQLAQTSGTNKSLSGKINDLNLQIDIINNPQYNIDKVKHELNDLRAEISKYENERRLHDVKVNTVMEIPSKRVDDKQINELYAQLPEFNKVNKVVPMVINRLKSLNTVHGDIGNTIQVVSHLDEVLQDIKSDLTAWNKSIDTVNENIEAYTLNFATNKQQIESQLQTLDSRLHELALKQ